MASSKSTMTTVATVAAIALVLACSSVSGSPRDQYKAGEKSADGPVRRSAHATDQNPSRALHAADDSEIHFLTRRLHRERYKRNVPWNGFVSAISQYQPQAQTIPRPYYVPVLYGPGGIPFYLPPQPQYSNVGYPQDNRPFMGPTYLPPNEPNNPDLVNRVEGDSTNPREPEQWIWGIVEAPEDNSINSNGGGFRPSTPRPRPTRPTVPADRIPGSNTNERPTTPRPNRPTRPTVPADRVPAGGGSNANQLPSGNQRPNRPSSNRPTESPQRPPQNINEISVQDPRPSTPRPTGNCVYAILSCCAPGSRDVSERCFENRGCPGPFWGRSPCEDSYIDSVIQSSMGQFT